MAANKTFSELPLVPAISGDQVSGLDRPGTVASEGWTFLQALTFVGANLPVGAKITFVTSVPTGGSPGDVAFYTISPGRIYQNVAGTWTVMFTFPDPSAADGTLLYGNGVPLDANGKEGDSYLNKLAGSFYLKGAVIWTLQYTIPSATIGGAIYFTDNSRAGIAVDLATGIITLATVSTSFPGISANGIIRGNFDLLFGSTWITADVPPTVTKDGSGNILTAVFDTGNTGITQIRGRIF